MGVLRDDDTFDFEEPHEKTRVLMVDDQLTMVKAVESLLKREDDIEFHFCRHASKAIDLALALEPSVILQDLEMPEIHGMELLTRYRNTSGLRSVPIIVLSSTSEAETKAKSFDHGANDYLVKVPERVELVARIRHLAHAYHLELAKDQAMDELRRRKQQLGRANKELESKNDRLARFDRMVAHDLKNPLASIFGYSDYVLEEYRNDLPEEVGEIIQKIRKASSNMVSIVEKVLAYSRAGGDMLEMKTCYLEDIIGQARSQLDWQFREKNASLEIDLQAQEMRGDVKLLVQVFVNLISNALKYCPPERRPAITIASEGQSRRITVTITDNGMGIPQDKYDRIFVEFERLESGRNSEGSGIGLSTVRKIIQAHKGYIWVESELGAGSTFTLTLPM